MSTHNTTQAGERTQTDWYKEWRKYAIAVEKLVPVARSAYAHLEAWHSGEFDEQKTAALLALKEAAKLDLLTT